MKAPNKKSEPWIVLHKWKIAVWQYSSRFAFRPGVSLNIQKNLETKEIIPFSINETGSYPVFQIKNNDSPMDSVATPGGVSDRTRMSSFDYLWKIQRKHVSHITESYRSTLEVEPIIVQKNR